MKKTCTKVYLGISIDGYLAGKNNDLEWLEIVPNPKGSDLGFSAFMKEVDALLMGKNTFEVLCSFNIPWPYNKPVFVLSNSLQDVPKDKADKAFIIKGSPQKVLETLNEGGYFNIYIDGGRVVQSFLKEDLIDEITLSTLPIILGEGVPLFNELSNPLTFELVRSETLLGQIVKSYYRRKK